MRRTSLIGAPDDASAGGEGEGPLAQDDATPERRPRWCLLGLGLLALFLVAMHIWWLYEIRRDAPLQVDEAGYLGRSFANTAGFQDYGIHGLIDGFWAQSNSGPLIPTITVAVHLLFPDRIMPSFLIQLPLLLILIAAAYGIGTRLSGPRFGLLTAVAVAATPEIVDFTRTYQFVIAPTAFSVAALWALMRSEGLTRSRWLWVWGACLGLMVLARTMTIAFVPGHLAAVGVVLLRGGGEWRRRALAAAAGIGALALVAGPWYLSNASTVLNYLADAGYRDDAEMFGQSQSVFSWRFWTLRGDQITNAGLLLPLALIAAVAGSMALVVALRRAATPRRLLRSLIDNDALIILVVLAEGYLALTSTTNYGVGFTTPLLPLIVILGVASIARVPWPSWRRGFVVALAAVSALNVVAKADIAPVLSERRAVSLVGLGPFVIVDGEGYLHRFMRTAGQPLGNPAEPIPPEHKRWLDVSRDLTLFAGPYAQERGSEPLFVFGLLDPLVNVNTFAVTVQIAAHAGWQAVMLGPERTSQQYQADLNGPFAQANFLVTGTGATSGLGGHIDQREIEAAAAATGFRRVYTSRLPDGREIHLWWLGRSA